MREFIMKTERIGFSLWKESDIELARLLWGEPDVTHYICADGIFTDGQIKVRLEAEINNWSQYHVQYYPVFELRSGELIGCCGLRLYHEDTLDNDSSIYEIGFHLRRKFWGQGYAKEAASAVMKYAFEEKGASKLFAGHHPDNSASRKLLGRLGFLYTGSCYYEPTGLNHPSYELTYEQWRRK